MITEPSMLALVMGGIRGGLSFIGSKRAIDSCPTHNPGSQTIYVDANNFVSHTQIFILQRNAQNFLSSFINKLYDVRLTTRELFDFQFEAQCKLFSKMDVLKKFPLHRDF